MNFLDYLAGRQGRHAAPLVVPVAPVEPMEPVTGKELWVKGSMIVKTNLEATTNVRIEVGQTVAFNPGQGATLQERRDAADRELRAVLTDLMSRAEQVRAGHHVQASYRPLAPGSGNPGLLRDPSTRSIS